MEKPGITLTEAFNNFADSFTNLRNLMHEQNPGKEKEIDAKLEDFLNHPENPLKKIQAANFNSELPKNAIPND